MIDTSGHLKPKSEVFRCAHCSWTTLKWRTNKSGKRVSGWIRLQHLLEDEHGIVTDLAGLGEDE